MLQVLSSNNNVETHLVISKDAETNIQLETDWRIDEVKALADVSYDVRDVGAAIASGSFRRDGMVVAPCTVKTMSALANSYNENLLVRAGDVTLKERKKLVLVVRETPLHLGHLRSMEKLTEMGAIIMPPVPAFYGKPKTLEEVIDHTVGRVLDLLDITHDLFHRWAGVEDEEDLPTS